MDDSALTQVDIKIWPPEHGPTNRQSRKRHDGFWDHLQGCRPAGKGAGARTAAENSGFTYCWFYDSHILWRESFVAIAMLMEHTTKMRFRPCVTNPNTRDWSLAASLFGSLALQSGGDSTSASGAVTARFGS